MHGGGDLGNVHFRVLTKKLAHEVSVLAKVGQLVRAVLGGEGRALLRADVVGIAAPLNISPSQGRGSRQHAALERRAPAGSIREENG